MLKVTRYNREMGINCFLIIYLTMVSSSHAWIAESRQLDEYTITDNERFNIYVQLTSIDCVRCHYL